MPLYAMDFPPARALAGARFAPIRHFYGFWWGGFTRCGRTWHRVKAFRRMTVAAARAR